MTLLSVLFIAVILENIFRKHKSTQNERDETAQMLTQRFNSCWDIPTLKALMYREIGNFPAYEAIMSKAYKEQMTFLTDIEMGCPIAKNRITQILQKLLCSTHSDQVLNYHKARFAWILKIFPDLIKLFDDRQYKMNLKLKSNSNLFYHCYSAEEVKKRFRQLAFKNHPDRGGSTAAMKEIIRQYDKARVDAQNFSAKQR